MVGREIELLRAENERLRNDLAAAEDQLKAKSESALQLQAERELQCSVIEVNNSFTLRDLLMFKVPRYLTQFNI